jgi:hypothetical protein
VTLAGISVTQASRGLRVPTETAADDAANAARKQVVLEDESGWSWSWNDPITTPPPKGNLLVELESPEAVPKAAELQ